MEFDFREILDIGLEIEFSNIKRETSNFVENMRKKLNNFKQVHDASSETPELTLGGIPVQFYIDGKTNKFLSILNQKGLETYGGELNSPILPSLDFKQHIYKLMDFLLDMGESYTATEQDSRGSIHVHVNVSKDITHKHLIRLLELGLATESIFYKLGGMGRVNRGVKNSFIYQRPLTLPPCVRYNNRIYPIFYYPDLLNSKSKHDFYNKYGDSIYQINNGNHYVTQRYMGLNFYSIPYRGSIEFRYANKTLVPEWIIAWIILCQKFTEFALTKDKDNSFENEYRKLEDNKEISTEELFFIFDKLDIPQDTKFTLLDIWRQSPTPYFNGKQTLTHLPSPTFFSGNTDYITPRIENAENIKVADVRTIGNDKSMELSKCRDSINEIVSDYIIDTTGVKRKLKDLEYLSMMGTFNQPRIRENNRPHVRNLSIELFEAYRHEGLDITNCTENRVNEWVSSRILNHKFIPFELLRKGWFYEFSTPYNEISVIFMINNNEETFKLQFRDVDNDIVCDSIDFHSQFSNPFKCYGFNFTDVIESCIQHPDNFFENHNNNELNFDDAPDIDFDRNEGN